MRRWAKTTLKPNIVEIQSAQEFMDSLLNASDRLLDPDTLIIVLLLIHIL